MADRERLARDGDPLLGRPATFALAALAIAFGVVIVGGYRLCWTWTGFSDNGTIWDWVQLLLVPFLLPSAVTWLSARAREDAGYARPQV
jgi:hypothetical protein